MIRCLLSLGTNAHMVPEPLSLYLLPPLFPALETSLPSSPPSPKLEHTLKLLITSPHLPWLAISSGPDGEGQQWRRHQQEIPWEQ